MEHHNHIEPLESPVEYLKFVAVICGIILLSLAVTLWRGFDVMSFMANFMGMFFIVFGAFKLFDLEMFVLTYRGYDIIAKRFKWWGWAFPFIELGLGAGYLIFGNSMILNILTIIITGLAGFGVLRELLRKSKFKCACLGKFIRLPLSKVSFVEDAGMLIMAAGMIIYKVY